MRTRILTIAVVALALQACATMSEDECAISDWHTIGYEDGASGQPASRIGEHRKACAKHGVAPDLAAYQAGRDEGLHEFCQPDNGFNLGARGGHYSGACPSDLDADFREAYQAGRQLHELESRVNSTASQIAYKKQQIDAVEQRMQDAEMGVISDDASIQERARYLLEAKDLADEKNELQAELEELRRQKRVAQRALKRFRTTLAYNES
jgi:hypothetical protein